MSEKHNESSASSAFTVQLSFQGKTIPLEGLTLSTTATELFQRTRELLFPDNNNNDNNNEDDDVVLKILYKGKQLQQESNNPVFSAIPKKTAKLIVMASHKQTVETLNNKRSDPLLRGFDNERKIPNSSASSSNNPWHMISQQHQHYKFVRFQTCTTQSFGHRAGDSTPHAFQAHALLEKLAHDPGIVAIMSSRELVVNTLGEMDPIDDRIMQQKEQSHDGNNNSCLLGYNTNHGLRIDLRLRTLDLKSFLPYQQLVATLIHELSHNWVGEHDIIFWTNFGQMRVEYLHTHQVLATRGIVVHGQTTAQLAGLQSTQLNSVYQTVMDELQGEMAQHGLPALLIAPAIQQCCLDLQQQAQAQGGEQEMVMQVGGRGQRVGMTTSSNSSSSNNRTARELALAAAENRRAEQKEQQQESSGEGGGGHQNHDGNSNKSRQQKKDSSE